MHLIKRFKWPLIGAGLAVLLIGFLLFRPDKLFIDDAVDESLADAFGVEQVASPQEATTTTVPPTTTSQPDEGSMTEDESMTSGKKSVPADLMGDKEALDLVRSYYAIPENQRRRLFELARVLSDVA